MKTPSLHSTPSLRSEKRESKAHEETASIFCNRIRSSDCSGRSIPRGLGFEEMNSSIRNAHTRFGLGESVLRVSRSQPVFKHACMAALPFDCPFDYYQLKKLYLYIIPALYLFGDVFLQWFVQYFVFFLILMFFFKMPTPSRSCSPTSWTCHSTRKMYNT